MNSDNTVIPSTQRKDGTWRKEVKIRPGYVNLDEMPRYVVPRKREEEDQKKAIKQAKARYEGVPVGVDPDEWRQMKEAEEKKKQKKRIRKKKDGHNKNDEDHDNEEHGDEDEDDNERDKARDMPESWEDEEKKESVVVKTKEKEKGKESKKAEEKEEDDGGEGEDPQKQARKLKKKLRQIELLEQKHAEGKELNTDEMSKIAGKKDLVTLLESLKI